MASEQANRGGDILAAERVLKTRMMHAALDHLEGIDLRSVAVLQKNGLVSKAEHFRTPKPVLDILADSRHQDRMDVPAGPMIFYRNGKSKRRKGFAVTTALFSSKRSVRSAAITYLCQLGETGPNAIGGRTLRILSEKVHDIEGQDAAKWRQAAISAADAVEDDFLCNLAGLKQCLFVQMGGALEEYLSRVLCPKIPSLDTTGLVIQKPSEQKDDVKTIISRLVNESPSLTDACDRYYQAVGYLPLYGPLSLAQLVGDWLGNTDVPENAVDELWMWADGLHSPLARYHACAAMMAFPDAVLERFAERFWGEFQSIVEIPASSEPGEKGLGPWSLRCMLARHYVRYFESHLPESDGERIAVLAWWVAEHVAEVLDNAPDNAVSYLQGTLSASEVDWNVIWQIAGPAVTPSQLRYGTLYSRSIWSLGILCAMGPRLDQLSKDMPSDMPAAVTTALSLSLLGVFPSPSTSDADVSYAFEHGLLETANSWTDRLSDSNVKAAIGQLIYAYGQLTDIDSLVQELSGISQRSEADQFLIAVAVQVAMYADRIPLDVLWERVKSLDWCRDVFLKADLRALETVFEAFCQIQVRHGDNWRTQLPHCYAYACEQAHGDTERQRSLFAAVVISSMVVDTASAIERLLSGSERDLFADDVVRWREHLDQLASICPDWVAGRIRATLPSLWHL